MKCCPAPDPLSDATLESSSSYASPLRSVPEAHQFSWSIRSTTDYPQLSAEDVRAALEFAATAVSERQVPLRTSA